MRPRASIVCASIVIGTAFGCGAGDDELDLATVPQDEGRCLSCDVTTEIDTEEFPPSAPKVSVSPGELMFYPSSLESPEFGPKPVTILNLTTTLVAVTRVGVAADPKDPTGGEGYFTVEAPKDQILLEGGGQVTVEVTYLGSTDQQSAVLVVNTTHPTYHTLIVLLTGKYFIDSGGE